MGKCGSKCYIRRLRDGSTTKRDRTEDRLIHKSYQFLGNGIKSPLRDGSARTGLISRFLRI